MSTDRVASGLVIDRMADGNFVLNVGAAYPVADLVALICEMLSQFPQRRLIVAPLIPVEAR